MNKLFNSLLVASLLLAGSAWAYDTVVTSYINLSPAIIGNYDADGKFKHYKADIALRVKSNNADRGEYHKPLIRDQLVLLFAKQTADNFSTVEDKEAVRKAALQEVQRVLEIEEGEVLVDDLLFNNLVIIR